MYHVVMYPGIGDVFFYTRKGSMYPSIKYYVQAFVASRLELSIRVVSKDLGGGAGHRGRAPSSQKRNLIFVLS